MKILIVASNMVHISNFHLPYINELKNQGHNVYVMARGEGADFNIDFKKRSLSLKNYKLSFEIRKILEKESFDIVFLHTSLAAFWVRMAMRGMKKRPYTVNTVHGYLFGKSSGSVHNLIYLKCERLLRKQTDEIIVMNKEDYEIATKNKLCIGKVTLSNGMGVNFKSCNNRFLPPDDKINITFVGEISKRKNQLFLVKAMNDLKEYTLTLVGDGEQREEIEAYIEKHCLQDRVRITGFTKNVYEYLEACHIYASASKIEGLPFNIMEAMYMSKPIVASDIKGHSDLLKEDQLYELDNMEQYVELIRKTEIKKTDYETKKYALENVFGENMRLYTECLKKIQPAVEKDNG